MPVIEIASRSSWYPRDIDGDSQNRTGPFSFEESTTLILGRNLPHHLLAAMQEYWPNVTREQVAVDYRKLHQQGSGADIWVSLRVGVKWADQHQYMVDQLVRGTNELILARPGPPGTPRPSFDVEVVLTNWHGTSMSSTGQVLNSW